MSERRDEPTVMPERDADAPARVVSDADRIESQRGSDDAFVDDEFDGDFGGDAACWLQHVCTECGALVEGSTATPCWRCGAVHDPTA